MVKLFELFSDIVEVDDDTHMDLIDNDSVRSEVESLVGKSFSMETGPVGLDSMFSGAYAKAFGSGGESVSEDFTRYQKEKARLIADIVFAIYGDSPSVVKGWVRHWDETKIVRHKKGVREGGRFAAKNSPEDVARIKETVGRALRNKRSAGSMDELIASLSELTVSQLHSMRKEFEISASGRTKVDLVKRIADRLDRGRRIEPEPEKKPEPEPEPEPEPDDDDDETVPSTDSGSITDSPVGADATPNAKASAATSQLLKDLYDENYAWANKSAVPPSGRDIPMAARHVRNAWRSLMDEATVDQRMLLLKRKNLERNEPHMIGETLDPDAPREKVLAHIAMAVALSKFPGAVYDDSFNANMGENARENTQKEYVESWRQFKDVAEKLAPANSVSDAVSAFGRAISNRVLTLRNQTTKWNPHANQLVKMYRAMTMRNKTTAVGGAMRKLQEHLDKNFGGFESPEALKEIRRVAAEVVSNGKSVDVAIGDTSYKSGRQRRQSVYDHMRNFYDTGAPTQREGGSMPDMGTSFEEIDGFLRGKVGLDGLQPGNSMPVEERLSHMYRIATAVVDLSDVTGLRPDDISLGRRLGVAYGARGKPGCLAHYEPANLVIALTREHGSGSFAHEWGHAFDHYVNTLRKGKNPISKSGSYMMSENVHMSSRESHPVLTAMSKVTESWKSSGYYKRLREVVQKAVNEGSMTAAKANNYWMANHEIFARSFELWSTWKLEQKGQRNTYLCALKKSSRGGVWPTYEEVAKMDAAFTDLFDAHRETNLNIPRQSYGDAKKAGFVKRLVLKDFGGESVPGDDLDDVGGRSNRVNLIADIVYEIFGDAIVDETGSSLMTKGWVRHWDESKVVRHKKGVSEGGRFAAKNSPEDVAAIRETISGLLRGGRTNSSVGELVDSLSRLTVSQLRAIKSDYQMSASGRTKDELVARIARRLDSGRRLDQSAEVVEVPKKKSGRKNIPAVIQMYDRVKGENPGHLILINSGDGYETFRDDARTLSDVIGTTVTTRDDPDGSSIEMAWIPQNRLDQNLPLLVKAGYKVAIVDKTGKELSGSPWENLTRDQVERAYANERVVSQKMIDFASESVRHTGDDPAKNVDLNRVMKRHGAIVVADEIRRIYGDDMSASQHKQLENMFSEWERSEDAAILNNHEFQLSDDEDGRAEFSMSDRLDTSGNPKGDSYIDVARGVVEASDMNSREGEIDAMREVAKIAKENGLSPNELWSEVAWGVRGRDIERELEIADGTVDDVSAATEAIISDPEEMDRRGEEMKKRDALRKASEERKRKAEERSQAKKPAAKASVGEFTDAQSLALDNLRSKKTKLYRVESGKAEGTVLADVGGRWWVVRPDGTYVDSPEKFYPHHDKMVESGDAVPVNFPDVVGPKPEPLAGDAVGLAGKGVWQVRGTADNVEYFDQQAESWRKASANSNSALARAIHQKVSRGEFDTKTKAGPEIAETQTRATDAGGYTADQIEARRVIDRAERALASGDERMNEEKLERIRQTYSYAAPKGWDGSSTEASAPDMGKMHAMTLSKKAHAEHDKALFLPDGTQSEAVYRIASLNAAAEQHDEAAKALREAGEDGKAGLHASKAKTLRASASDDEKRLKKKLLKKSFGSAFDSVFVKSGGNCGTGAGGFQPGNTCAGGDGSGGGSEPDFRFGSPEADGGGAMDIPGVLREDDIPDYDREKPELEAESSGLNTDDIFHNLMSNPTATDFEDALTEVKNLVTLNFPETSMTRKLINTLTTDPTGSDRKQFVADLKGVFTLNPLKKLAKKAGSMLSADQPGMSDAADMAKAVYSAVDSTVGALYRLVARGIENSKNEGPDIPKNVRNRFTPAFVRSFMFKSQGDKKKGSDYEEITSKVIDRLGDDLSEAAVWKEIIAVFDEMLGGA